MIFNVEEAHRKNLILGIVNEATLEEARREADRVYGRYFDGRGTVRTRRIFVSPAMRARELLR